MPPVAASASGVLMAPSVALTVNNMPSGAGTSSGSTIGPLLTRTAFAGSATTPPSGETESANVAV